MATPEVLIAANSNEGIKVHHGVPKFYSHERFEPYSSKNCRAMCFSKDGKLLSWSDQNEVIIINFPSFIEKTRIPKASISFASFSPQGTCLALWNPYTVAKDSQQGNPNLHIWHVEQGKFLRSFIQKKQNSWKPQWTDNEDLCARSVNNEVHFFEKNKFETISKKMFVQKVASFSLSLGPPPFHIACFVPGVKGQPSSVQLYKYPIFEGNQAVIARKTFYKSDKVEYYWNNAGNSLVVLTSAEVDKSDASYYGTQALYFMSTHGSTSVIKLLKDGPIYSLAWSPQSTEFCVVYGYMPAKATIFNNKCEPVFDFGTGPRNLIYYSPHGNMLILAGFGNLRGNVEVWDLKGKRQISTINASDSTFLSWNPDGQHILTATTSPRLRIGNGYKVWHYSGSLLHEVFLESNTELLDIQWQPFPLSLFPQKPISLQQVPGIQSSQPQASKEVYRPPGARGKPSKIQLHDKYEAASNMKFTDDANLSKAALKNKKKKEAKKAKKEQEKESIDEAQQPTSVTSATPLIADIDNREKNETITKDSLDEVQQFTSSVDGVPADSTAILTDPEKVKKLRSISKKLEQIRKLKEEQEAGKVLELNQLSKIRKEQELIDELQALYV